MREFERQNERMEMTSEMMGDAVDGVFEEGGEEEETDELVSQVLDEIGISLEGDLVSVPNNRAQAAAVQAAPVPQAIGAAVGQGSNGRRSPRPPPGGAGEAGGAGPGPDSSGGAGGGLDDDLQARLDKLRKS